ncbi:MAG: hypothetical protein LUH19_08760 [Lachnospiraceae bacterium]|nr:hypothetical protein [Lachnospiraceae bacterium]
MVAGEGASTVTGETAFGAEQTSAASGEGSASTGTDTAVGETQGDSTSATGTVVTTYNSTAVGSAAAVSSSDYLVYYDPSTGEYSVYNAVEYLSQSSAGTGTLLSENEKLQLLQANGYTVGTSKSQGVKSTGQTTVYLVCVMVGAAALLSLLLYVLYRRNYRLDPDSKTNRRRGE